MNAPPLVAAPRTGGLGHPARFRLPQVRVAVGAFTGGHRSGWPHVIDALAAAQGETGLALDPFVEATFRPGRVRPFWLRPAAHALKRLAGRPVREAPAWQEPWIGIFHLPHQFPEWFDPLVNPRRVFEEPNFQRSLPHLRGAVALSRYHGNWLRQRLGVPVLATKHPTEPAPVTFDWNAFLANSAPKLVQVGWYLRNYRAIYQVPVPAHFTKVHLLIPQGFVKAAHRRTDRSAPHRHRPAMGDVTVTSWLANDAYDRLFAENVMFLELFDASANNAVVEAIARSTPLVVNRHPAVEEYLGEDYPLFYRELAEVPKLLENARIRAAHEHLRDMDKSSLQVDRFISDLDAFTASLLGGGDRR